MNEVVKHRDIRLDLLGGFKLVCDDRAIDLPTSAQRLLAFLALRDRPLLRTNVAGVLWNETTDEKSCASLRSSLWRLRRSGFDLVEARRSDLRLSPQVRVDVRQVIDMTHELLSQRSGARFLDLDEDELGGDLLPDWYDDWVLVERERLRQLRLHALEALAIRRLEAGRHGEAAGAALSAVSIEPLRESAQRVLIRVHLAEGNVGEAVRQYRSYKELLLEDLGLAPSEQLESLMRPIMERIGSGLTRPRQLILDSEDAPARL
ncbi:MAG TPA: BTAD domain-containing putative transcriptional regulator [Actinomycetota bacterium]|nr:BTAD domain-containing putative transcriptional regulator [Actinomycetota bacterium]